MVLTGQQKINNKHTKKYSVMKKKIIRIVSMVAVACTIGIVLANNKAKIDKAANPVKEQAVIPVKAYEVEEDSFNISFSINGKCRTKYSIACSCVGLLYPLIECRVILPEVICCGSYVTA